MRRTFTSFAFAVRIIARTSWRQRSTNGAGWSLANFHTEASGGKRVYSGWPQFGVFALKVRLIVLLDSLRTFKVLRHGYDVLAAWASRDDVARNWESVMVPADALSDDEAMAIALEGAGRC